MKIQSEIKTVASKELQEEVEKELERKDDGRRNIENHTKGVKQNGEQILFHKLRPG